MKIKKIHIKNHYQFKNLDLDLTYPVGHKKAGEALDKVCFIGQSGTGKTTLLEEIWNILTKEDQKSNIQQYVEDISFIISYHDKWNKDRKYLIKLKKEKKGLPNNNHCIEIIEPPIILHNKYHKDEYEVFKDLSAHKKIYFNLAIKNQYTLNRNQYIFPLSIEKNGWDNIKEAIALHQKEKIKYDLAISDAFKSDNLDLAREYAQKLAEWEANNDTPLLDLANNYLNKILKNFNLTVKTALESWEEVDSIHLMNPETLETIPLEFWSTGIKNIIARTIPLYTHKFEEATICIDEPETSLYPDIQRKIIDIYTRLAPKNQFFYATHSPIIASSFEPWEIVELKFDKEGYVYREQYWEGENHVDNYKYDPRYLRWDSILQNIFDLENDGSDERKKMLQEFANLDNKLKERKRKGDKLSKEDPEVQELMEGLG